MLREPVGKACNNQMRYNSNLKEYKRATGRLDAMHALYELSLRHLESAPDFNIDSAAFIKACSTSLGPRVDTVSVKNARIVNAQLCILSLFSLFEEFLLTLNTEVLNTRGIEIFKPSSKIQHAIDALPFTSDDWIIKKRLLHYYRLVRNLPAHPFNKNQTSSPSD